MAPSDLDEAALAPEGADDSARPVSRESEGRHHLVNGYVIDNPLFRDIPQPDLPPQT